MRTVATLFLALAARVNHTRDNHFATHLTMLDGSSTAARAIAISNTVQTVRSTKTARGFGSNYASGGSKSVDRTEPPQAARVLLELMRRYHNRPLPIKQQQQQQQQQQQLGGVEDLRWVVALLFDDLVDWHDWFLSARMQSLPKVQTSGRNSKGKGNDKDSTESGLICLGSNAVPGFHDYAPGTIAAARMESGLDNSPM